MKKIRHYLILLIRFLSKTYPPTLDKYDHQCGFTNRIDRTIEAHEQRKQSVYVFLATS